MHTAMCCVAGSHQTRLRIGAIKASRSPEQCPCVEIVLILSMSFFRWVQIRLPECGGP